MSISSNDRAALMCCRAEGSEFAGTAGEPPAEDAVDMSLPAMERYKTRDELEAFYDTDYDTLMRDIKDLGDAVKEQLGGCSIYFVGMMGAGKTTLANMLSATIKYCPLDLDELIKDIYGNTPAEIIAGSGEEWLRTLETDVLKELAAFTSTVVATGGGVVKKLQNWGYMTQAITIYLEGEPELLTARVLKDGVENRPLLARKEGETGDPYDLTLSKLKIIMDDRRKFYENADITIPLQWSTAEEDKLRSAPPIIVLHRCLCELKQRMDEKKAEMEDKRSAQYEVVDNTKTAKEVATARLAANQQAEETTNAIDAEE